MKITFLGFGVDGLGARGRSIDAEDARVGTSVHRFPPFPTTGVVDLIGGRSSVVCVRLRFCAFTVSDDGWGVVARLCFRLEEDFGVVSRDDVCDAGEFRLNVDLLVFDEARLRLTLVLLSFFKLSDESGFCEDFGVVLSELDGTLGRDTFFIEPFFFSTGCILKFFSFAAFPILVSAELDPGLLKLAYISSILGTVKQSSLYETNTKISFGTLRNF